METIWDHAILETFAIGIPDSGLEDELLQDIDARTEHYGNMMFIIENVKNKNWDRVLTFYKYKDGPVNVKITSTGETVLHMAVRDRELEALEKLTEKVEMELADNRGNTCLHLAAKMGYTDGCIFLAKNKPDRIRNCNSDNETPLFLAALYGREETFFVLAQICDNVYGHDITYEYGRRGSDGSTVLHCAINEDFLDLACSIMYRYPEFVHRVDQRGYSPLHLLACKTSSFRSCSRFTWLQQIIDSSVPDGNSWVRKVVESRLDRTANSNGVWKRMGFLLIQIVEVLEMKEREQKSIKIMEFILREFKRYNYTSTGCKPSSDSKSDDVFSINQIWYESLDNEEKKDTRVSLETSQKNRTEQETPILVASKNGITEIVRGILEQFSEAIYDVNSEGKNVMLLAVEHRQPQVYGTLLKHVEKSTKDLLYHNDNDGNNALHLAAIANTYRSWFASNAVLQMQWEINWFEFVKKDMPKNMLTHQNKEGKTPEQSFMETHTDLMRNDVDWLLKTSDSCTIVAALIATVAFATSAALPGGIQGKNGEPVLQGQGMFEIFAISSLVALCFSLMAVIMFLSILTSRHQVMDFHVRVPLKLLIGLTALFISIASMLISFCGGHFFVVRNILNNAKIAEYLVAFLPVTFFVIAQCPLYYKLFKATILKTDP